MTGYEILALSVSAVVLGMSGLAAWFAHKRWKLDTRRFREMRRLEFLRDLNSQFMTHNWKFIEHWENPGVRPGLTSTPGVEVDQQAFGKRVVCLDHLNFLWHVFAHKELLTGEDLAGFRSWARSWFDDARASLAVIFETGDLYPLDFVEWLREKIFKESFKQLIGSTLDNRLQQRRTKMGP